MTIEARPSKTGLWSRWLAATPMNATARPSSAAVSSKRTVNRLGSLPWWMADSVRRVPRVPRNVRQATLKDRLSNTAASASTMYATSRVLDRDGMPDVRDALVDGHPAADAEDAHGDDQAPEVDLHAVSERVVVVGRSGAPVEAVVEQPAVAGVDERVDALADHRRAAGHGAGDELDRRDRDVADDRGDDRFLGFLRHGRSVLHAHTRPGIHPTYKRIPNG